MAVQVVNRYNFEHLIRYSDKPSLIKFWHDQCPMCVELGAVYEKLSNMYADRFNFFEIDTTDEDAFGLPAAFEIDGVPEIYFFYKEKY